MKFPKKFMYTSELQKLGLSRRILRRAYGDKNQRFAFKISPEKKTSAICYDTDGLAEWFERNISAEVKGMQRG